jgi:hypothetical protein
MYNYNIGVLTFMLEIFKFVVAFRRWPTLTSRDWQKLRESRHVSLSPKWSLNLKGEESQRKKFES